MSRIVVTGGSGFLGSHLVSRLAGHETIVPRSKECDLRDPRAADALLKGAEGVYHLAAIVGGIGYNVANPALLLYDNTAMGLNVLEAARRHDVPWVILAGSACAYPGEATVPTREDDLWAGYPEKSNAPYGVAKRVLGEAAMAYTKQYGMRIHHVIPANLYGPGDHFDPAVAHVLPSLMTRFHRAKLAGAPEVACWGDGTPTRDLLYIEDCAALLARAPSVLKGPEPVNLGTGREHSISQIAHAVKDAVGYEGKLRWDTSMPNGQRRRALSTERMESLFGKLTPTPFEVGLRRTYEHFLTTPWARPEPAR